MKQLTALFAALLVLLTGVRDADAALPDPFDGLLPELRGKLEVMVKVDPRIDRLLRDLAKKVPQHLYDELVVKTNDLLRQDFFDFRDGIQELVDHELLLIPCVASMTLDGAIRTVERKFDRVPNPAREFDERIAEAEEEFNSSLTPRQYAVAYAGLLNWGDDVSCAEVATVPNKTDPANDPVGRGAVQIEIDKARKRLQPKWLVWTNLEDTDCSSPHDCLTKRHAEVYEQIQAANPKDKERSGAMTHFGSTTVPPTPGLIADLFDWEFDIAAYERPLIKLALIEKSLEDAATARELSAEFVKVAKGKIADAEVAMRTVFEKAKGKRTKNEAYDELGKAKTLRAEAGGLVEGSGLMDPTNPDLEYAKVSLEKLDERITIMEQYLSLDLKLLPTLRVKVKSGGLPF